MENPFVENEHFFKIIVIFRNFKYNYNENIRERVERVWNFYLSFL